MKNNLTPEQYKTLKPFQHQLKKTLESGVYRHIPRPDLNKLHDIYKQLTGITYNSNLSCSKCVKAILNTLAEAYLQYTPPETSGEKDKQTPTT